MTQRAVLRNAARVAASALAVAALGCAGAGDFAKELGGAVGEGALEGFADYVTYETEDRWGQAWTTSGRGVEGFGSRSIEKPDCAAVDDELALYVGDVIRSPGRFVSTLDGELSQRAFESLALGGIRLTGPREGGAIGVIQTTAGRYGRFVLHWDDQPILHDLVVYDAETGQAVLRFDRPMPLAPHVQVNLDPGEGEGFDLLYGPAPDGRPSLAAGEGAGLSFPMASLCAEP